MRTLTLVLLLLTACTSYASKDAASGAPRYSTRPHDNEVYAWTYESGFVDPEQAPLSTFAIDVDTASYANVRRYLQQRRQLPPAGAVRIEELLNAFEYNDPAPAGGAAVGVQVDAASAPWTPLHRLVRIAITGKSMQRSMRPDANLVFLIDTSGSMKDTDKLPLVKRSLFLLLDQLEARDRVAIVTYARGANTVLPSTSLTQRSRIEDAIDSLKARGSTNGSAGLESAYERAAEGFIESGVNRVILCTDGDFNRGRTSRHELQSLIQKRAKSGVYLSVLGLGQGNLNDANLELLADHGNGHYAYIDSLDEARRVLSQQLEANLVTVAEGVKAQVEFNPSKVAAYRLIGYENRRIADNEFANDNAMGGVLGGGRTVVALYEIIPHGYGHARPGVESYKYRGTQEADAPRRGADSAELLTVKVRYQKPGGGQSTRIEVSLVDGGRSYEEASEDFRFTAAVAAFGMVLRESPHRGGASYGLVQELAGGTRGEERSEFRSLVRAAERFARD